MNPRNIAKSLLALLIVLGILMLTVPLVDLLYEEPLSKWFLVVGLALVLIGYIGSKIPASPLTTLEALTVAALAWVMISLISALVLHLETGYSIVDTVFESVSGFTGTGFTVFSVDGLKHSIIWWRSLMQWSGELGFVVFAMVLIPYFYSVARNLYGIERPIKIEASFYRTALQLILIYVVLTIMGTLAYIVTGMTPFEAVNHVMTTVATGGMSTYDQGYSVIFTRAPLTYIAVFIFMVLGGMNLYDLYKLLGGKLRELISSEEFRYYIYSLTTISLLVFLSYVFVDRVGDIWYAFYASIFNNVSGMTTTGFNIGTIAGLSTTTKALITLGMFIGGMTFSTAGGIKTLRLVIVIKKFKRFIMSMFLKQNIVKPITIDKKIVSDAEASSALLFVILHAFMAFSGAVLLSAYGYSFIDSLFEATSAISCVGLSAGVVSQAAPAGVKMIISALMLLGRIEYLHIMLFFALLFRRGAMRLLAP